MLDSRPEQERRVVVVVESRLRTASVAVTRIIRKGIKVSQKKCSCNKNKPSKMFVTTTTTTVLLPSHLAEQASDSRFSAELMPSAAYVYGEPSSSLH